MMTFPYQHTLRQAMAALGSSADGLTHEERIRAELEEQERLDMLDPLRHLLSAEPSSSSSGDGTLDPSSSNAATNGTGNGTVLDGDLLPQQRHSIINETGVVIYCRDGSKTPETISGSLSGASEHQRDEGAVSVTLKMDVSDGCGGKIWPAAEVLGAYITSRRSRQDWEGKRIVELGTGTGLVGLLVGKLGLGAKTWITDQIPMLPLMRQNLELNELTDSVIVEELNWGEPIPPTVPSKPDVLLLADCVYLEVAFQPLVDTMVDLSTSSTEILFCYQKRRKADKRFFALLKRSFTFTDIEDDDPERRKVYNRQGTQLLRIRRKGGAAANGNGRGKGKGAVAVID